jgi:hypothetical protein
MTDTQRALEQVRAERDKLKAIVEATAEWKAVNKRRAELIDKDRAYTITPAEQDELARLQKIADLRVDICERTPTEFYDHALRKVQNKATELKYNNTILWAHVKLLWDERDAAIDLLKHRAWCEWHEFGGVCCEEWERLERKVFGKGGE